MYIYREREREIVLVIFFHIFFWGGQILWLFSVRGSVKFQKTWRQTFIPLVKFEDPWMFLYKNRNVELL